MAEFAQPDKKIKLGFEGGVAWNGAQYSPGLENFNFLQTGSQLAKYGIGLINCDPAFAKTVYEAGVTELAKGYGSAAFLKSNIGLSSDVYGDNRLSVSLFGNPNVPIPDGSFHKEVEGVVGAAMQFNNKLNLLALGKENELGHTTITSDFNLTSLVLFGSPRADLNNQGNFIDYSTHGSAVASKSYSLSGAAFLGLASLKISEVTRVTEKSVVFGELGVTLMPDVVRMANTKYNEFTGTGHATRLTPEDLRLGFNTRGKVGAATDELNVITNFLTTNVKTTLEANFSTFEVEKFSLGCNVFYRPPQEKDMPFNKVTFNFDVGAQKAYVLNPNEPSTTMVPYFCGQLSANAQTKIGEVTPYLQVLEGRGFEIQVGANVNFQLWQ